MESGAGRRSQGSRYPSPVTSDVIACYESLDYPVHELRVSWCLPAT
jgi:hypothetical protein